MTFINKQKFLAELGKLLTFMYEEDRQRAVELYSRMFEEAEDERALLQALISPTRQAVIVARAYNSNMGRLSLSAESKAAPEDRDENGVPDYVQAIGKVREQAWAAPGVAPAPRAEEKPEEPEAEKIEEPEAEKTEEPEAEKPEEPAAEKPEEPEAEKAEETEAEKAEETEAEKAEETEAENAEASEAEKAEEPEAEKAEEPETEKAEEPEAEKAEEPEAEKPEEPEAEKTEEPEAEPAAEADGNGEEKNVKLEGIEIFTMPEAGKETPASETGAAFLDENSFNVDNDELMSVRKPRVFLLILYILLAIPLTIACILVLLVPAVLFLALSVAAIICGVVLVSAAISSIAGLALLSDIMILFGVALVLFALGLLFLWTAIWFIGGAIVGLVHGVAALCEKWCYKEVSEA